MALGLIFIGLALAGLCVALRLYMSRAAEDALHPGESVNLVELRDPIPGNAFLACPPGYCMVSSAALSPVFDLPLKRLQENWADVVDRDPRTVQVAGAPYQPRLAYVQHSALFGFPDVILVEFIALGPNRSSLAIYSRARYGRGDFGTNRRRVLRWLDRLAQISD